MKRQLSELRKSLEDKDTSIRLKSAKEIAREALKETSIHRRKWMRNPRTTDVLIDSLRDPEPKTVEQIVAALAEIFRRYFIDIRAYSSIVPLLKSKRQDTRYWAVQAIGAMMVEKYLDDLVPLLQDRSATVRTGVCSVILGFACEGILSPKIKQDLQDLMLDAQSDNHYQIRNMAANILREIGDPEIIETLEAALDKEEVGFVRESLQMAIEFIKKRSQ